MLRRPSAGAGAPAAMPAQATTRRAWQARPHSPARVEWRTGIANGGTARARAPLLTLARQPVQGGAAASGTGCGSGGGIPSGETGDAPSGNSADGFSGGASPEAGATAGGDIGRTSAERRM